MEKTITEKSIHRKRIVPVLAVFLLMAVPIIWQCKKQEYSATQLLEYYRQGLKLQSRLSALYRERKGKNAR